MDCEGAEFEIILSAPRAVLSQIAHIAMEYHRDPKEIVGALEDAGLEVVVRPTGASSGFLFADRYSA
jgi:hypothetical protein